MVGSINSTSEYNRTYNSVGNAAIKTSRPRLALVYDRDALDRDNRTPRVPGASRRSQAPQVQNRRHRAGTVLAAVDARAFLRLIVIISIVMCCSVAFEGMRSTKINQMLDAAPVEEVKAVTGDTLWSIAEQHCSNDIPTEDVVTWIRSHNGLSSAMITPGQRISVPIVAE